MNGQTIRDHLKVIADNYDEALDPVRRAAGSHVTASKEPPLPISAHILDVRAEAHRDLMYWARFLLDEVRDVNGHTIQHGPDSTDVADLVPFVSRWVDWLLTEMPEDAENLATEAEKHARELRGLIDPPRREWFPLGDCPITVADADGNPTPCATPLRAYPDEDDKHRFVKCSGCGTEDTIPWWMSQIVPEGADLGHADTVIACVTSRTFRPLTHEQVRQWAARGNIQRHGKDVKGRTLYSTAAVLAYAQDQTKEEVA